MTNAVDWAKENSTLRVLFDWALKANYLSILLTVEQLQSGSGMPDVSGSSTGVLDSS